VVLQGKDTVGFDKLLELYALTLKPEDRLKGWNLLCDVFKYSLNIMV
jgi:hypothetical protein